MFEHDYALTGKHATFVKYFKDEAKLYERYIDVYMSGAIFGLLYNRWAPVDNTSKDRARIYADAFATCRSDCVMLYRLVMLLEKKTSLDSEARVDRAFRDDAAEEHSERVAANMDLFHEYVRGGIEVMYELFIEGCLTDGDYLERALEMMEDFRDDIAGVSYEEKLARLI